MPSPWYDNPSKTLSLLAAVSIFGAFFTAVALHSEYFLLKYRLSEAENGHLQDLSVLSDYLANSDGNVEKLSERSVALARLLREYGVDHTVEDALGLVGPDVVKEACGNAAVRLTDSPLAEHCEKERFRSDSKSGIPNCDALRFENNRKSCRNENDDRLSVDSSYHCSTAECLVDNAIFQSALRGGDPCAKVHSSLSEACRKTADSYDSYVGDPEGFSDTRLESVLLWTARDAVSSAARSAVLDFPDSPSTACSSVSKNDIAKCEKLSKELFSYVQKRGLRNRFAKISDAVKIMKEAASSEGRSR